MGNRRVLTVLAATLAAALVTVTLFVGPAQADFDSREPTAADQLMIEMLNRTRADPDAEAALQGIDLNEGLAPGTISSGPREPLAVNLCANLAAFDHNNDLHANFDQLPATHRGTDGRSPTGRVSDAGANWPSGASENNAWVGLKKAKVTQKSTAALHRNLFRDFLPNFEVKGRGHRKGMLNGTRNEVGVAVTAGPFGSRTATITTYDTGTTSRLFITGVAIEDSNGNDFYDMGEGLRGVRFRAVRDSDSAVFETTTWKSGGYSLVVPAGTYDVTASGGGLPLPLVFDDVTVTDQNVKIDAKVRKAFAPPPPAGVSVVKAIAKQLKDGSWKLQTKKTSVSFGVLGLSQADVDALLVRIDGVTYFDAAARAAEGAVVKPKFDAALGLVRKLVIKDAAKNKLVLDLKKGTFQLKMKALPGFDPTGGSVNLVLNLSLGFVSVDIPGVVNTKGNKFVLGPANGAFTGR